MAKQQTVFIHIPRTAGTSFGTLVADEFRRLGKRVCPYSNWPQFVTAKNLDSYDLIGGQTYYPLINLIADNPIFMTMLGEPVSRLISHQQFLINGGYDFKGLSIEACLKHSRFQRMYNNFQTRQLGAFFSADIVDDVTFTKDVQATAVTLERAKARLIQFAFVGIKEQFAESIVKYNKVFSANLIPEPREPRPWKTTLSSRELALAKEMNNFDIELYEFGLELFRGG